jgi:hypothetical protein
MLPILSRTDFRGKSPLHQRIVLARTHDLLAAQGRCGK